MKTLLVFLSLLFSPLGIAQQQEERQPPQQEEQQQQQQQEQPLQDYVDFVKRVQEALKKHGFDPGEVNGLDEGRTQAAIAQFQLSRNLPASGSMDEQTLNALGVERTAAQEATPQETNSSTGGSQ